MADSASSPAIPEPNPPQHSDLAAPNSHQNKPDPVPPPTIQPPLSSTPASSSAPPVGALNPNSNPQLVSTPPPPSISFAAMGVGPAPQVSGGIVVPPPAMPSFRPVNPQTPQFSPIPNAISYQNPGVQPPGVSSASAMTPGAPTGAVSVSVPPAPMQPMMMPYQIPPGQPPNPALRPYAPMPNGYAGIPGAPQGTMPVS